MKRIFVLILLLSGMAYAQTFTVSGHVVNPNTNTPTGALITFKLINTGTQQCKVSGTGLIVPNNQVFTPDSVTGVISGTLYRNDFITCGSQTNTQWSYVITAPGVTMPTCALAAVTTTSLNVDSAACTNTVAVVTPPTGDTTYCRLDGSNCGFTGNVTLNTHNVSGVGGLNVGSSANNTGSITANDAGVFSGNTNEYNQFILNSCSPGAEFNSFQASTAVTDALTGCVVIPNPSVETQVNGVAGYVRNLQTNSGGVGVFGLGTVGATNAPTFGGNLAGQDTASFVSNRIYALEADVGIHNTTSVPTGILYQGVFYTQPTNGRAIDISIGNHGACVTCFWPAGVVFEVGATQAPASGVGALLFLQQATGATQPSQGMTFATTDGSSNPHTATYLVNASNVHTFTGGGFNPGGQIFGPNGASGTPTYSNPGGTAGFFWPNASNFEYCVTGTCYVNIGATGVFARGSTGFAFTSGDPFSTANDSGIGRGAAGFVTVDTTTIGNAAGVIASDGNQVSLTADWTCGTGGTVASCVTAQIIGSGGGVPLTFTLPLVARSWRWECDGVVGQATGATLNQWNILTATNGATNVTANYTMATAATAFAAGAVTDQASTTTTFQIAPSWTLGGTGTKMPFHIWGRIEGASASGTVLSLQLVAPTVADLVTIFRGSGCRIF